MFLQRRTNLGEMSAGTDGPSKTERPTQSYYVPRRVLEERAQRKSGDNPAETSDKSARTEKKQPKTSTSSTIPSLVSKDIKEQPKSPGKHTRPSGLQLGAGNSNAPAQKFVQHQQRGPRKQNSLGSSNSSSPTSSQSTSPRTVSPIGKQSGPDTKIANELKSPAGMVDDIGRQARERLAAAVNAKPQAEQVDDVKPKNKVECICQRPTEHLACRRCGTEWNGRLSKACALHPKLFNLMDHSECPNRQCRSSQLIVI